MSQLRLFAEERKPSPAVGLDVSLADAAGLLASAPPGATIGLDIETTSGDPTMKAFLPERAGIAGIGVWCPWVERGFYFPLRHRHGPNLDAALARDLLGPFLVSRPWAAYNGKFEMRFLDFHGWPLSRKVRCSFVGAHLLDENASKKLADVAPRYLGEEKMGDEIKRWLKTAGTEDYGDLPVDLAARYCVQDARLAYRLDQTFAPELERHGLGPLFDLEMRVLPELAAMEARGHLIDLDFLMQMEPRVRAERDELAARACAVLGRAVDLGSPAQLRDVFYAQLGLVPTGATGKGAPSVDDDALSAIDHPFAAAVLAWRRVAKKHSTYLEPLVRHHVRGVIHASINDCGAASGRMSMSDPNLQNVKDEPDIRSLYVARPGWTNMYWDYSQIQFRIFAHYAGDRRVQAAYRDDPDADFHRLCLEMMPRLGTRDRAKTVNLALLFGMGAALLAKQLGCSVEEAKSARALYYASLPLVRAFQYRVEQRLLNPGYIFSLYGRRRRNCKAHIAFNALHQSVEADMMREAIALVGPMVREVGGNLLLPIHDELIAEVPTQDAGELRAISKQATDAMVGVSRLSIPVRCKTEFTTTTWADKKGLI